MSVLESFFCKLKLMMMCSSEQLWSFWKTMGCFHYCSCFTISTEAQEEKQEEEAELGRSSSLLKKPPTGNCWQVPDDYMLLLLHFLSLSLLHFHWNWSCFSIMSLLHTEILWIESICNWVTDINVIVTHRRYMGEESWKLSTSFCNDRLGDGWTGVLPSLSLSIYIYIYTYIYGLVDMNLTQ